MISLYQFATSPFCEKIRRVLNYKGLPFELVEVPRARIPELTHITPSGKLPSLVIDERVIWDSSRIVQALDEAFPERPVVPTDPYAAAIAHVFEDWADESLYFYEVAMRLSWDSNIDRVLPEFAATMPGVPLSDIRERILQGAGGLVRTQGLGRKTRDEVVLDVKFHLAALTQILKQRTWLVGETLSIADVAVAVQLRALMYAAEVEQLLKGNTTLPAWLSRIDDCAPQ